MKIIILIIFFFTISSVVYSQTKIDDVKFKMTGTWKKQENSKKRNYINRINFISDTTGTWSVDGIICNCEFFKIYEDKSKVYIKRLIILDGWSDPIEIILVDKKRLIVKHFDGETVQYLRVKSKNLSN